MAACEIDLAYDNRHGLRHDAAIQHLIIGRADWVASGCDIGPEPGERDVQLLVTAGSPADLREVVDFLKEELGLELGNDLLRIEVRDV